MSSETFYRRAGAVSRFLAAARFTSVLSTGIVAVAFGSYLIRSVLGWPGLIGALSTLILLASASFAAQLRFIEWTGLLPLSVLCFVAWCGASVFWTAHQWVTVAGVTYQIAIALLAIYLALVRDTIQVVRTVGDVLRALLGASLVLEVFSGIIIDQPLRFLGMPGNIASGGPIVGVFGTRNDLSVAALIGFVSFLVEWRTRSVRRGTTLVSLGMALACLGFARSPVVAVAALIVALAALALAALRALSPAHRRIVQWMLGGTSVVVLILAYAFRALVLQFLDARSEFFTRYDLWLQIWHLGEANPLLGWGWSGLWWKDIPPYNILNFLLGTDHDSALNAYLDVYLQVGLAGLVLFAIMVALAFARAWIVASNKRTVVYIWVPLILVALITTSVLESAMLVGSGWLILVVCCVKASQSLSWRHRLSRA